MVKTEERFSIIKQKIYGRKERFLNRKSYVGCRFGKLLVTEMIYDIRGGKRRASCKCICDCGTEIVTSADSLRRSKKSCGCDTRQRRIDSNRNDLTGKRFNRLIVTKMLWENRPTKCKCICDCGNEVEVIASGLTSGKTGSCGCYQKDRTSTSNVKDWTGVISSYNVEFLRQAKKNTKGQWLWACRCGECGKEFVALPAKVMNGHITSCGCSKKSSHERTIAHILDNLGVEYIEQYRFEDCKSKYTLPFDFAVILNGSVTHLIEYDGRQHFMPVDCFGGIEEFREIQRRDAIKNKYCKLNNINLLRLPYTLDDSEIKRRIIDTIYP